MDPRDHETFMRRCLELAAIALDNQNTPVGSLLVLDGEIVGEGIEQLPSSLNLTGHAEIAACQDATDRRGTRLLRGSILYTTAEPCLMCSYVIRQCEIASVVYGRETPIVGGFTSAMPILTTESLNHWRPAPQVIAGILRAECERL